MNFINTVNLISLIIIQVTCVFVIICPCIRLKKTSEVALWIIAMLCAAGAMNSIERSFNNLTYMLLDSSLAIGAVYISVWAYKRSKQNKEK